MRVSTIEGDDGFVDVQPGNGIEVLFDAERIDGDCVTADEERGFVVVAVRDARGILKFNEAGDVQYQTRFGEVKIVMPEVFS